MPAHAAKVVQLSSAEGTYGSTGTAVNKLMGITDVTQKINQTVESVKAVGWFGPSPISAETGQSAELKLEMVATYEEMPHILNGLFTALATGVGTTAPYNYPYTAPVLSTQAVYTYTIEHGTTGACYRASGAVVNVLNIKGAAGGLWTATADFLAQKIIPSTSGFTTGLSDSVVNPIRMADTILYIDAITSTVASSAQTATLIDFDLNLNANRHLKTFAGSLTPASWGDGRMEGTLKLTAEFNTNGKALVDEMLGSTGVQVQKMIRIAATQGSSATVKTMNLDFAGVVVDGATLFGDRDGNMTAELSFDGKYSTGLQNWFACNVQNGCSGSS